MKKIALIVFILLMSMLVGVSGFGKAKIKNRMVLEIVPSSKALVAISTEKRIEFTVCETDGQDINSQYCDSTEADKTQGTIKIKNNSAHRWEIKHIRCTTKGFSEFVKVDFKPELRIGKTVVADIIVNKVTALEKVNFLSFEVETEWADGNAVIQFTVPVSKRVDKSKHVECLDAVPDTTTEPVQEPVPEPNLSEG